MNIDIQIKEASEKLKKLKKEKEELERLKQMSRLDNEVIDIAEVLHDGLCNHNHTDGCDWYYGDWSDVNLKYSREEYYKKAKRLREYFTYYIEDGVNICDFLKGFLDIVN